MVKNFSSMSSSMHSATCMSRQTRHARHARPQLIPACTWPHCLSAAPVVDGSLQPNPLGPSRHDTTRYLTHAFGTGKQSWHAVSRVSDSMHSATCTSRQARHALTKTHLYPFFVSYETHVCITYFPITFTGENVFALGVFGVFCNVKYVQYTIDLLNHFLRICQIDCARWNIILLSYNC